MKTKTGMSNLDIVRSYLNNERPFTQLGYEGDKNKHRTEGEEWDDINGIKWKRENGKNIRLTKTQGDLIRECIGNALDCKHCKLQWKWASELDRKFLKRTKLCERCLINHETKLRVVGVYEHYEKYRLALYELGYLKNLKIKIEETMNYFKETGGDIVKLAETEYDSNIVWKNTNKDKIVKDAAEDLKKVTSLLKTGNAVTKQFKQCYLENLKKYDLPDIISK